MGVVRGDDLEVFPLFHVTPGNFDGGSYLSFVLGSYISAKTTDQNCVEHAYHPANPLLGLLPIAYVYEATAGETLDGMLGSEF